MSEKHDNAHATEAARVRAPVTDRVNAEPSILNGMTFSEAQVIAGVSLAVFLVVGGLIFAATRVWQAVLLLALFGPVAVLWYSSQYLQTIKRGRPDGYYTQAIHLWMSERSLVKPKFIRHHGYWDLGRTLDLSLVSPLEPSTEDTPPVATPLKPTNGDDHERP